MGFVPGTAVAESVGSEKKSRFSGAIPRLVIEVRRDATKQAKSEQGAAHECRRRA